MLVLGLHAQSFLLIMPAVWPCMCTNISYMKNNETQKVTNRYLASPCYFGYIGSTLSNINASNVNCSQFLKTVKKVDHCKVKSAMNWYRKKEKAILQWKKNLHHHWNLFLTMVNADIYCLCCSWICHTSHLLKIREYSILLTFCDPSFLDYGTKRCNETYTKGTREDKALKDNS